MTYPIFNPPIDPQTVDDTVSIANNSNNFGDGYEQSIILGLNSVNTERSLHWPCLSIDQLNEIETFLETNKGKTFTYNIQNVEKKFKCFTWSISRSPKMISLKATFKEVYI